MPRGQESGQKVKKVPDSGIPCGIYRCKDDGVVEEAEKKEDKA